VLSFLGPRPRFPPDGPGPDFFFSRTPKPSYVLAFAPSHVLCFSLFMDIHCAIQASSQPIGSAHDTAPFPLGRAS